MYIAHGCIGLELIVIYTIFIIALPSSLKRNVIFMIGGLIIIHLINVFRCVGLVALLLFYDEYFIIAHHKFVNRQQKVN
jgi:exosortase/archaeosortase family protein